MTPMPSLTASSASASPTRTLRSSDSTTQGPAMRNGLLSAANRWGISVGQFGQRARGRVARMQLAVIARGADKSREQRVRAHQRDHRILALGRELARVGIRNLADVARELDDRGLEAEANPEERQFVLARPANRLEHPFDATYAEPARDQQPVVVGEQLASAFLIGEAVGRDPLDRDPGLIGDSAMDERLVNALITVGELGVLAHHGDPHLMWRLQDLFHHRGPGPQIGLFGVQMEPPANFLAQAPLVGLDRASLYRFPSPALPTPP